MSPKITRMFDRDVCGEENVDHYVCTEPPYHFGNHVARDVYGTFCTSWDNDPARLAGFRIKGDPFDPPFTGPEEY